MRLILVAVLCFASSTVFGSFHIGDKVHMMGVGVYNNAPFNYLAEKEIIDAHPGQYLVRFTEQVINGNDTTSRDEWIDESKLISRELIAKVLTNCASYKGARVNVQVASQAFDVCAIPASSTNGCTGISYYGDVPFGLVKMDITCDSKTELQRLELPGAGPSGGELTYSWGK